jgi:hypothetical protein
MDPKTLGLCDKKLRQKSYTKWGNEVKPYGKAFCDLLWRFRR